MVLYWAKLAQSLAEHHRHLASVQEELSSEKEALVQVVGLLVVSDQDNAASVPPPHCQCLCSVDCCGAREEWVLASVARAAQLVSQLRHCAPKSLEAC